MITKGVDGRTGGRTNGWTDERVKGRTGEGTNGWADERVEGQTDRPLTEMGPEDPVRKGNFAMKLFVRSMGTKTVHEISQISTRLFLNCALFLA